VLILGFYGKMEMKGLKENKQDENEKLEYWKLIQNSSKLTQARSLKRNSSKTHPSEFTQVKLNFFSSNSLKQVITRLSEMSLDVT